jgi:hypothetical protein
MVWREISIGLILMIFETIDKSIVLALISVNLKIEKQYMFLIAIIDHLSEKIQNNRALIWSVLRIA